MIKSGHVKLYIFFIGLFFSYSLAFGQESIDSVAVLKDSVIVLSPDTLTLEDEPVMSAMPEDAESDDTVLSEISKHSPAKATIMSAVLPGLGQIYNGKAWKVPIVYATIGTSVGFFIYFQNKYQSFRRAYIDFNDQDPTTNYFEELLPSKQTDYSNQQISNFVTANKDGYRRYRDWAILAVIITYGLNVLDANVDAHFLDYDINDNLSLHISPCFLGNDMYSQKIGLNLCFTF